MADVSSEAERWRGKYLDLVEQEEGRRQLLRRGLVCVSLAVDNIDPVLEKQLAQLRELLRGNAETAGLAPLIDRIENAVRQLDERRTQGKELTRQAFVEMADGLTVLARTRAQKKQLQAFRNHVGSSRDGAPDVTPLLREYLGLQHDLLASLLEGQSGEAGGFLSRLFGGGKPQLTLGPEEVELSSSESSAAAPMAAMVDEEPENFEIVRATTSHDTYEGEAVRGRVATILLGVLGQLGDVPDPERPEQLRKRWESEVQWPELPELLDETLSYVIGTTAGKAREYEKFLLGLSVRLTEVHRFMQMKKGADDAARQSTEDFGNSMHSEIAGIRDSVRDAAELDELRGLIQSRLDSIVSLVDEYRSSQREQQDVVATEVQELEQKLRQMEREAKKLRETVHREHQRALSDVLTGLPNRQAWNERIEMEFARWQRYGTPLSVAVLDVDFFKKINDTYGHLPGDKVLKLLARTLQKSLRSTDFIARFGGEEFVVLMPQTALTDAAGAVEKLRLAVQACPFHFAGAPVTVTISSGVAQFQEGDSIERLVDRADQLLLKAKQSGRNRVESGV